MDRESKLAKESKTLNHEFPGELGQNYELSQQHLNSDLNSAIA
jgi:hypothetical protein